jgi:peptidoglycan-associated lipoprotein
MAIKSLTKLSGVMFAVALAVGCTPAQDDQAAADAAAAAAAQEQQVVEKTPEEIAAEERQAQIDSAKMDVMNFGDTVFFDFDDAELKSESVDTLNAWAMYLKVSGEKAVIQGHTDERGTREYNISLGERRANAVIGYLASQGVDASQLEAVSYGEESPAIDGSNDYAWSKNRRAVLEL